MGGGGGEAISQKKLKCLYKTKYAIGLETPFSLQVNMNPKCIASISTILLLLVFANASLYVPASMLSPFSIPQEMGPEGLNAVKLAVGTRLISVLGSLGIGSAGSLATSLLGGPVQQMFTRSGQMGLPFAPIFSGRQTLTPRNKNFSKRRGPNIPTSFNIREATPAEVENFFGVLHRVDANKCISRLVCEIGANPKVLEGLGHNVKDVIG